MPRKLLKRWIPNPAMLKQQPGLHLLGDLLDDPNLFHMNRHSISVAFFVGIFFTFVPIPGQMLMAAGCAFIFRCNLPLSVALVWISNPVTIPPIFFSTYKFGSWLLQTPEVAFEIELSWKWVTEELQRIWKPLVVGSLTAGLFFATLSYGAVHLIWRWSVVQSWQRRKQRRKRRNNCDKDQGDSG